MSTRESNSVKTHPAACCLNHAEANKLETRHLLNVWVKLKTAASCLFLLLFNRWFFSGRPTHFPSPPTAAGMPLSQWQFYGFNSCQFKVGAFVHIRTCFSYLWSLHLSFHYKPPLIIFIALLQLVKTFHTLLSLFLEHAFGNRSSYQYNHKYNKHNEWSIKRCRRSYLYALLSNACLQISYIWTTIADLFLHIFTGDSTFQVRVHLKSDEAWLT